MENKEFQRPVLDFPTDSYAEFTDNLPTLGRHTDIPFEVYSPTTDRQTVVVYQTIIVRETPQYRAPTPTYQPTPYTDKRPTSEVVGEVMMEVGQTLGVVLVGAIKLSVGLAVGILTAVAGLLSVVFASRPSSHRDYDDDYYDRHKPTLPTINQGGSTNTVRDIHIHIGDNNQVNVKRH